MSKGSRKRRSRHTDGASPPERDQVWIFAPEERRESAEQRQLREETSALAFAREMTVLTRRTKRAVVEGGPDAHKRFELLDPRDAGDLYHAMHRQRVLVVTVAACWVRLDPSESPSRFRRVRGLGEYVRYKASFSIARGPGDPLRIMDSFIRWPDELCSEIRDPRILPLHVFDAERYWANLQGEVDSEQFVTIYGQANRRLDPNGRTWTPAPIGHGSDVLAVSGYMLPAGFHWDVQRGRGTDRLVTCHEVWRLDHGGSYANVYPDAYVRVGRRFGRRVWPSP